MILIRARPATEVHEMVRRGGGRGEGDGQGRLYPRAQIGHATGQV